jgi:hypothetical protein
VSLTRPSNREMCCDIRWGSRRLIRFRERTASQLVVTSLQAVCYVSRHLRSGRDDSYQCITIAMLKTIVWQDWMVRVLHYTSNWQCFRLFSPYSKVYVLFPWLHQAKMICDVTMETQQCLSITTNFWESWKVHVVHPLTNLNLSHSKMVEAVGLRIITSRSFHHI